MSSNSEKGKYTQAKEGKAQTRSVHPLSSRVLELMRQEKRKEAVPWSGYFSLGLTGVEKQSKKPKSKP